MKKSILFVTNHFRYANGVASVLRSLILNLDLQKYDIDLLAIYDLDEDFAKPISDKVTIIKGFGFYFRGFDKIINLLPPRIIYNLFVKKKYDLEIAFQFGIPTKMIAKSPNRNKLCWMHGYDYKMVLKKYYKCFPKIINVSREGSERLVHDGFKIEKCDYCYNIIDESFINEKSIEKVEITKQSKYVIVTVGRLSPEKGLMRYLQCINNVIKMIGDIEFWIIGSGSEEKKMREYIDANDLYSKVKMLGQQSNPYKFIRESDLYFCTSYREGFSTTCQEAAILGIPVITVNVNGAQEFNELAGCGWVIDNNSKAIESALVTLSNNTSILDEWKISAQKRKTVFYKHDRIEKINRLFDETSLSTMEGK